MRRGETYLLDAGMTSSGTNVVEVELAEVDFGQGLWGSDLARLGRQYPVDLNGLSEVEVGREDADLLGLTLKRQRERRVGGRGDVGFVDMQHGGVESMVGDGVEHGKQGDGEGDEEDTGCEKETAVAELARKVLFLVRSATGADETDGLTGLVESSCSGSVRVDALSSRTSTKILPGAVAVVRHVEGTQLPSTGCRGLVRRKGGTKAGWGELRREWNCVDHKL